MNKVQIHILKKTISIFTAFTLLFTTISINFIAFADEQTTPIETIEEQANSEEKNENSEVEVSESDNNQDEAAEEIVEDNESMPSNEESEEEVTADEEKITETNESIVESPSGDETVLPEAEEVQENNDIIEENEEKTEENTEINDVNIAAEEELNQKNTAINENNNEESKTNENNTSSETSSIEEASEVNVNTEIKTDESDNNIDNNTDEHQNLEEKENVPVNTEGPKKLKKKNRIQFKLKNQNISEEKRQKLLKKLERIEEKIEQRKEKRRVKQLLKEHRKEQKRLFKEAIKDKELSKAERKALRKQFKEQLKSLKDINKELEDELEDELRIELDDEERGMLEYIEPNYIASVQSVIPNDTDYEKQWSLTKIQASEAWETSAGDPSVVIAVLDTGMDFNHTDKPVYIAAGYDFINNDSNPQDDHGHGTFVSGLIVANTNNSVGVSGVCWNCTIMPVKVIDGDGLGTYEDLANGIRYAVDSGANVINMSLGGYNYSQSLLKAINYAHEKGVVIVAAGGNDGSNTPIYPGAYPNVIGVSATDENDEKWEGSNYGEYIDISAPGVGVQVVLCKQGRHNKLNVIL